MVSEVMVLEEVVVVLVVVEVLMTERYLFAKGGE